ncbi:MAG: hypothetical protein RLZZ241_554 [Bacteroidota bacterium]|jgi:hypothetical protein
MANPINKLKNSYRFPVGISVLVYLIVLGCGGGKKVVKADANHIQQTLAYLASDSLLGRDTGSKGIALAASYLEQALADYNIKPYYNFYKDTLTNLEQPAFNVLGYIPGADPKLRNEFIVLGAHYDHIGISKPIAGDSIANGANDNASGTAMLLELARNLTNNKSGRGILIAFFSAEERGLLGSKHLAKALKEQEKTPFAMLNFEMVGVPMTDKPYKMYLTGYHMSNLADLSNNFAGENLIGLLPQAQEYNLFQRSDNYAFYEEFKIPSHTYSTFDFTNYAYYHLPGDQVSEMDANHMAGLVDQMIPVVLGISKMPASLLNIK